MLVHALAEEGLELQRELFGTPRVRSYDQSRSPDFREKARKNIRRGAASQALKLPAKGAVPDEFFAKGLSEDLGGRRRGHELSVFDQCYERPQSEKVAIGSEAKNLSVNDVGKQRTPSKLFALVNVRNVHFDHRNIEC
jgi:hypothetical protein